MFLNTWVSVNAALNTLLTTHPHVAPRKNQQSCSKTTQLCSQAPTRLPHVYEGPATVRLICIACGRCRRQTNMLWLRSALFSSLDPLKMGPTGCPETSLRNYNCTPCNIPEESRSHLLCGGSPKSFNGWLVTTLYQLQRWLKRDEEKSVVSYSGCNPVFR